MDPNPDALPVSEWSGVPKGHGELILLVDDDRLLLVITARILARLGYQVIECHNLQVGFVVWQAQKEEIKLIITEDHFRDGSKGRDLMLKVQWLAPEFPVLLLSGRRHPDTIPNQPTTPHAAHLCKPYLLADFAGVIHRLIADREPPPLPWVPREKEPG